MIFKSLHRTVALTRIGKSFHIFISNSKYVFIFASFSFLPQTSMLSNSIGSYGCIDEADDERVDDHIESNYFGHSSGLGVYVI